MYIETDLKRTEETAREKEDENWGVREEITELWR